MTTLPPATLTVADTPDNEKILRSIIERQRSSGCPQTAIKDADRRDRRLGVSTQSLVDYLAVRCAQVAGSANPAIGALMAAVCHLVGTLLALVTTDERGTIDRDDVAAVGKLARSFLAAADDSTILRLALFAPGPRDPDSALSRPQGTLSRIGWTTLISLLEPAVEG